MSELRFGIFTDLHANYTPDATQRLENYISYMKNEEVDCHIQLGDLCPTVEEHDNYINLINTLQKPAYHVLGNHDSDFYDWSTCLNRYGLQSPYYYVDCNDYRLIILDTNPKPGNTATQLDHQQMTWLKDTILDSGDRRIILLSHAILCTSGMGIVNADEFMELIEDIQSRYDYKKVICAFNGHYHFFFHEIKKDIPFISMPSISNQWLSKPLINTDIDEKLVSEYPGLDSVVLYTEPLFSIVHITEESIHIKGCNSAYSTGEPAKYGQSMTIHGHPLSAQLPEFNMKINA